MSDAAFDVPRIPLELLERAQDVLERARANRREFRRLLAEWSELDVTLDALTRQHPEGVWRNAGEMTGLLAAFAELGGVEEDLARVGWKGESLSDWL